MLVPGYKDLAEPIASALRLHHFAERVISYLMEENAERLPLDLRIEFARWISDTVEEEVKADAYPLVLFASAIVRKYPPPPPDGLDDEQSTDERP
jgi:hypothetical protein